MNKIEFSDNDDEEEQTNTANELHSEEPICNNAEENVQPKANDQIDQKLNCFLNDLYAKKRGSNITFRRISQGNYEFGTQKVLVKLENEKIKGNY